MVQKQAALSGGYRADQFADDDPLAELARIVGFEQPRAGQRPAPEVPSPAQNPVFNLEDELLREFETFETPSVRAEPVRESVPEPVPAVVKPAEPRELVFDAPAAFDEPFDWSQELVEAEFVEQATPAMPVVEPVRQPSFEYRAEPVADFAVDQADDLADELERAFAGSDDELPDAQWSPQQPTVEPVQPVAAAPRITLPLANFQANPAPRREPAFDARPSSVEPVVAEPLSDDDWLSSLEPSPAPAALPELDLSALDNFSEFKFASDEVVAAPARPQPVASLPDFDFSFADELAAGEDAVEVDVAPVAASAPVIRAQPSAPVFEEAPASVAAAPAAEPVVNLGDDFLNDGEFELMLDDLELDLSELEVSEPRPAASAAAVVSPARQVPAATIPAAPAFSSSAFASSAASVARPVVPAPALDTRLPFDPDEIVEQDEHPESVSMPDVPDMAYVEQKEAPIARADLDYDIDTELAGLFENMAPAAPAAAASSSTSFAAAPQQGPVDDFDAFERALEEDFRRTLQNPNELKPRPAGRISLDEISVEETADRSPIRWAAAASAAVAAVLVAGGAYFWFSGGSSSTASTGEPVVIMADKDPVKVLPENPGGKSVPNQDKAVYDTVSGASAADPKQQSLISTSEEPVDVVQRTLMPDNFPMVDQDEGELMGTPVGETQDPRLLPNGSQTAAATDGSQDDPSAIAPRKVRTMIVKPDGTLVAQEVPAEAPMGSVASQGQPTVATPSATQATAPAVASMPAAVPAVSTPVNNQLGTTAAADQQPAPAEQQPVTTDTAALAPANTPVPSTRPAEQPVNVVGRVTDQGNVSTPAQAEAASPPAQSAVPAGSYVVQIASLPSEADAQASYRNLSGRYGSVIGGRGVDIKAAEIPGKGTYYRVRIPAGSKAEADALCSRYKAAGGSCLVAR